MKKLLGAILAAIMVFAIAPLVLAAPPVDQNTGNGTATVPVIDPVCQDFTTRYHFDMGSATGRNEYYPTFEYVFAGDNVHFWAKIQDRTIYNLENEHVWVHIDCPQTAWDTDVDLTFVTGIGATYQPNVGLYNGEFEADFFVPEGMTGLCTLSLHATNPTGGECVNDLSDNQFVNVNDILADPVITIKLTPNQGLQFVLNPNEFNRATNYPIQLTIDSDDDREGQGVIGNLSLAVTDLLGDNTAHPNGQDIIKAWNIRMRSSTTGGLGAWQFLSGNEVLTEPRAMVDCLAENTGNSTGTCYTLLMTDVATSGLGFSDQLFFELYFDSNHWDVSYTGAALGIRYSIY